MQTHIWHLSCVRGLYVHAYEWLFVTTYCALKYTPFISLVTI